MLEISSQKNRPQDKNHYSETIGFRENGGLLREVVDRYGTPVYVFSKGIASESVATIRRAFHQLNLEPRIFYSVKTNPKPFVLQTLCSLDVGAEIISEHEWHRALASGFNPDSILVGGTGQPLSLLTEAVGAGAAFLVVESLEDLRAVDRLTVELGKPARILVRVHPGFKNKILDFTKHSGSRANPAGIRADSQELATALDLCARRPLLHFRGFHGHIGSGISDVKPYRDLFKVFGRCAGMAHQKGLQTAFLDLGGGYPAPGVHVFSAFEIIQQYVFRRSGSQRRDRTNLFWASLGKMIDQERKAILDKPEIILEPGRALIGPAEALLLRVRRVAHHGRNHTIYCDRGALSLSPLLLAEYHEIENLSARPGSDVLTYRIRGNMPAPFDVISNARRLPSVEAGDILALHDVGAYFSSMGSEFGGPTPATVVVESDKGYHLYPSTGSVWQTPARGEVDG